MINLVKANATSGFGRLTWQGAGRRAVRQRLVRPGRRLESTGRQRTGPHLSHRPGRASPAKQAAEFGKRCRCHSGVEKPESRRTLPRLRRCTTWGWRRSCLDPLYAVGKPHERARTLAAQSHQGRWRAIHRPVDDPDASIRVVALRAARHNRRKEYDGQEDRARDQRPFSTVLTEAATALRDVNTAHPNSGAWPSDTTAIAGFSRRLVWLPAIAGPNASTVGWSKPRRPQQRRRRQILGARVAENDPPARQRARVSGYRSR